MDQRSQNERVDDDCRVSLEGLAGCVEIEHCRDCQLVCAEFTFYRKLHIRSIRLYLIETCVSRV